MRILIKTVAPLALAAMSCLSAHAAEAPEAVVAAVNAAFEPLLAQYDVPGLAVGVTVNGEHYFFNYGVAARDTRAAVNENTLFELGSVSKMFTSTLGNYAVAQGHMALDDHPSKYMPELAGTPIDQAALLHLGTYTVGGLPLQFPEAASMEAFFQQWQPQAAPGARRDYSNPAIGLFGYVAAKAMGRDFADIAQTEIFPGLGLQSTYIHVPEAAMANYAWGYRDGRAMRVNPGWLSDEAYGVKSTTADMIRFVEANIAPDDLSGPLKSAVQATQVGYFRVNDTVQGLGWEQYPFPVALDQLLAGNSPAMSMEPNPATALNPPAQPSGPTLFNKTGSTNGFGAYVAFVPAQRIGVVMLANTAFPIPARVTATHAVLEQLAKLN